MQDSKLIELLKVFSNKELKRLTLFTSCKLFNVGITKHEVHCQLLSYLIKFAPTYTHRKLTKQQVFRQLFGSIKYNDKKMRDVMHGLFKIIEDYIVTSRLRSNDLRCKLELLDFYRTKNLPQHFDDTKYAIQKLQDIQQKNSYKDARYHYANLLLAEQSMQWPTARRKLSAKKQEENKNYLDEVIYNLDKFYLIKQLKQYCESLNRPKIMKQYQQKEMLIQKILPYLTQPIYLKEPLIAIYHQLAMMHSHPDKKVHYFQFKALIDEHVNNLPHHLLQDLYIHARNYCIWKVNGGQEIYLEELLDIYNTSIEKKLLPLTPASFKNIVTTGLRISKLEWIEQFIEKNIAAIEAKYHKDVYNYNYAHLFFHKNVQKNYLKIINLLEDAERKALTGNIEVQKFNDIFYQIDARRLLLKTYYEIDDPENIEKMLANLEVFLSLRQSLIPEGKLKSNRNFIKILKQLYKISPYDRQRKQKIIALEQETKDATQLTDKQWLLKQFDV